MSDILGHTRTVRELLKGIKYKIDYYQREYKWTTKQVRELIDDLSGKFLEEYSSKHEREEVAKYPNYFLGSIIITKKNAANYIVDGQQRLTSLTLLLILLRHFQKNLNNQVNVDELIFSEKFGKRTFNIQVDERESVMEALFEEKAFELNGQPESVKNMLLRYQDMEEYFPEELTNEALPYFIDWLLENVVLVEITAQSDDDAYTIFETMNDRGLSLSPTEMLKGYLLSNIEDSGKRDKANNIWRNQIVMLNEFGKDVESDFFKTWLRSQYARKIRERKKGAKPEDFDRMGTEFHRWLRDESKNIGLERSDDFYRFIERDLTFYCKQYLKTIKASRNVIPGMEHVLYNAHHGFTLQYMVLLAPLSPDDSEVIVNKK